MLLPTITYGFAIIYSFGKQGLITKILGAELFEIYGFNGLWLGYTIYTLPTAFLIINNTFKYLDQKYVVVSKLMGDSSLKTFYQTLFYPLAGTLATSCIQVFFMSFTDFGIPVSVGGNYDVVASYLYNQMLGSIPNFNNGAVIAIVMLVPSIFSVMLLKYLEKFNIRYNKTSEIEIPKNTTRDITCATFSTLIIVSILSIFAVIFIVPITTAWPYDISLSFDTLTNVLSSSALSRIYQNSIKIAFITAISGTIICYMASLVTARSNLNKTLKGIIEYMSLVTNTVPGMVLGIAFMLTFSGTSLQGTVSILVLSNIIHFFSTPYLMFKNSLDKMNTSFEVTAKLLGDNYFKTLFRIITPNLKTTLIEVFMYFFINSMVTISAVVFLASARTMTLTTKIKELQHYANFDEIFIYSILILLTNLAGKLILKLSLSYLNNKKESK